MSGPPPPPQVSPDGKFYWDGERWVPMQGPAPSQPPPPTAQQQQQPAPPQGVMPAQLPPGYEIKKKGHFWRNGAIGCGGLIVLIIVIAIAASGGSHGTSTPAASPSNSTTSPATAKVSTAPAAGPKVLLDKTGSGINTTAKFSPAGDWQIVWSYDCSSFGSSGNFQIYVYNGDGSLSDVAVNELGAKGSDVTNEHQGGTYYLQMNSECKWHVIVKG
jgi:hypothetical protein